jgi:hypothetical protein
MQSYLGKDSIVSNVLSFLCFVQRGGQKKGLFVIMCVRLLQENGECAAGAARAQSSDGANEPGNSQYEKPPSLHCGEFLILKTGSKYQSNQGGVFCLSYHTSLL